MPTVTDLQVDIAPLAHYQGVFVDGRSRQSLQASVGVLIERLESLGLSELCLDRRPSGILFSDRNMDMDRWKLIANGSAVVSLEHRQNVACAAVRPGAYSLNIEWAEREWSHPRTGPRHFSYGSTERLTMRIRPGRYLFSLKRGSVPPRTLWRRLAEFLTMEDSDPRELNLASFTPRPPANVSRSG